MTLPARESTNTTPLLRRGKLDRLIGHHIADAQVTDILQRLDLLVTVEADGGRLRRAGVSTWRSEEDLVEEVARVYGYNNIPDEPVRSGSDHGNPPRKRTCVAKRVKTLLNGKTIRK
ncbi:hypothetical protein MJ561_17585 [Klebsiella pneumoniae]|nr:hypothetical protein MJ561_17585 [Klebsiella pneumoniae]